MWKENVESIIEDLKAYEGLTKEQLLTLFIQQKLSVNTTNYVEELENDSSLNFQQFPLNLKKNIQSQHTQKCEIYLNHF